MRMAEERGGGVDLGFFNGDVPAWDLEREFYEFELESRFFPSKVRTRSVADPDLT